LPALPSGSLIARQAALARALGDRPGLLEVRPERLEDRVRLEVDPEALRVQPRHVRLLDERVGPVEPAPPAHDPLAQDAQVAAHTVRPLLGRRRHRHARRERRADPSIAPHARVDRHAGAGGGVQPLVHQRGRVARVLAGEPAHDVGDPHLRAELHQQAAAARLGGPRGRAGGICVVADAYGQATAENR
jgi:hypothetical protein